MTSVLTTPAWTVQHHTCVASTNPLAAHLPPWHAVRSDQQTRGFGRTGRHWVSDAGGLWLSAVLPTPGSRKLWSILPLAAGWAIMHTLSQLGVAGLRLRWPNDLMVGPLKLAGLLVETHSQATAVVGIGLNVFNFPEHHDSSLKGHAISLQQLLPSVPDIHSLTALVLDGLAIAQNEIALGRFSQIATALNQSWSAPRSVILQLATSPSTTLRGDFHGIDAEGRLLFQPDEGALQPLAPEQVTLLREDLGMSG